MADNNLEFTVKLKNEGVDKLAEGLDKVDQKVDALGDSAKQASQDLKTLDSATADASDELKNLAAAEAAAEKQASELAAGAASAGQGVKALAGSAATAGGDLKTLGNAESAAKQQAEELAKGASNAGQSVKVLATAAATADGDLNTLASAEKEVKTQAQELGTGTKSASERVKELGSSASATSDDLQKLSAATSLKTQAIKSGLDGVKKSAADLSPAFSQAGGAGETAGNKIAAGASQADKQTEKLKGTVDSVGDGFTKLGGALTAAFSAQQLVKVITDADSLQRGMVAITGSTEAAGREMAFVRKTSNELGLELQTTGQSYLQLLAATKGTRLEGQATRDVFTSISRAMSALGKSSAETENALRAVSQIASKGTVSMEELRGQLGEALPGALKAAADGMGVTTQELIQMVESGGVLAEDLLPKLAASLDMVYSKTPTDGLLAQYNRFKNSITEVAVAAGENGLAKALGDLAVLGVKGVGAVSGAFVGVGKDIGAVAGAVATLNFAPLAEDLGLVKNAAGQTASELQAMGASAAVAGEQGKEAFRKAEIAAQNADTGLSQAAKNAVAQFDKLKLAGDTAAEAVGKIGKGFDLSNSQGIKDATEVLAKLANDGKITAEQFAKAWQDSLKGIDLADFEARARKAFGETEKGVELLKQALDASLREAIKRTGLDFDVISGGMGKASRSAINDTDAIVKGLDSLKKQGIDTGQVLTTSIGKSINAADSKVAIDAVKAQIESLRKVLGDKITDGLLDQAKQKTEQLKDALDKAKPGINSVAEAMKQLGITSDQSLKDTAKTAKESYDLMVAKGTSSARELAEGFRKSAEAAITANNGIAPSWVTAQAATRGFELQVDSAGKAILKAMGDGSAAVDKLTGSVQGGTKAIQEQLSWLERLNKRNSEVGQLPPAGRRAANGEELGEGVTEIGSNGQYRNRQGMASDAKGTTLGASTELGTLTGIAAFLKAAGVSDDAAARKIALEFSDGKGDIPYLSNPGQKKYGGDTMSMAVLKAAERYTFGQSGSGMQSPSAIPKPESQTTRTVNINLNGITQSIKTDAAGADVLENVLNQLASAAGRS